MDCRVRKHVLQLAQLLYRTSQTVTTASFDHFRAHVHTVIEAKVQYLHFYNYITQGNGDLTFLYAEYIKLLNNV